MVPDDVTIRMVEDRLNNPDCEKGYILDGFPRNIAQAEALDKMLAAKGSKIDAVVYVKCDDEVIMDRGDLNPKGLKTDIRIRSEPRLSAQGRNICPVLP